MSITHRWHSLGKLEKLKAAFASKPLQALTVAGKKFALSYKDGTFGAIHGSCNHAGGPLGEERLDGEFVVCPWHYWKFHRTSGEGEPGYTEDRVPRFDLKEENGELWINLEAATNRNRIQHAPHSLTRPVKRADGPLRVAGISTTAMDPANPRYSTSEELLKFAIEKAESELNVETKLLKLADLSIRNCEGFYSKAAPACTWPCSITQMDANDQMDQVYELLVHWADVVILATPIRWGSASSLYFKMAERLNCVQNQITLKDNVLIQNKVVGLIVTGGQDNIQAVAGSTLAFFAELGFVFPPFPYVAHSLGWTAENMQRNVRYVAESEDLRAGSFALLQRSLAMAEMMIAQIPNDAAFERGGRKAHRIEPGLQNVAFDSSHASTSEPSE